MRAHRDEFLSCEQAAHYLDEAAARDPDVWIIQTDMAVISRIDRSETIA